VDQTELVRTNIGNGIGGGEGLSELCGGSVIALVALLEGLSDSRDCAAKRCHFAGLGK
jgi:hypothetical protein